MPTFPTLDIAELANVVIGVLFLTFGRRLFWLFVGLVGFITGFSLAPRLLPGQNVWVILLAAFLVGLLGAFLAVIIQRVAAGIAGFLIGGYLLNSLLINIEVDLSSSWWITYLIGGLIGFALILALFDWALIILSSLAGASLIVQSLALAPSLALLAFLVLLLVGIAIQAGWMHASNEAGRRAE